MTKTRYVYEYDGDSDLETFISLQKKDSVWPEDAYVEQVIDEKGNMRSHLIMSEFLGTKWNSSMKGNHYWKIYGSFSLVKIIK